MTDEDLARLAEWCSEPFRILDPAQSAKFNLNQRFDYHEISEPCRAAGCTEVVMIEQSLELSACYIQHGANPEHRNIVALGGKDIRACLEKYHATRSESTP